MTFAKHQGWINNPRHARVGKVLIDKGHLGRGSLAQKTQNGQKSLALIFFSVVLKCRHAFLVADTQLYTMPCQSVHRFISPSIGHIFELLAVFALLPLPNHL